MRSGVIDIGSRSIKLIIGESTINDISILESLKNTVAIAHDTFLKNRISQETINQTLRILEKYQRVLKEYDVADVKTIATTAVREAGNRDILADTVLRKAGLSIEILSPGDIVYYIDAYISHKLKNSYPIHEKNLLIAELGSGSLDISLLEKGFTITHIGLPLGTLRLQQLMSRLSGSLGETYGATTEYIANEFSHLERTILKSGLQIDDIILIDENYSGFLHRVLPLERQTTFFPLSVEQSQAILSRVADKIPDEIGRDFAVPPEIADTFIAYTIILNLFFTLTRNQQIYLLDLPLAEAVLAHSLLNLDVAPKYNKINQLISLAEALGRRYDIDTNHARAVAQYAETLFIHLKGHLGLRPEHLIYLRLAALLHDIGMFIHNRAHHKHSEYIIGSLSLSRLSDADVKLIACIARYHRKATPSENHPLYHSLARESKILVQKLSSLLRMANALDHAHRQKIKRMDIRIKQNQDVTISVQTAGNFLLEQSDFAEKKTLFEEITGNTVTLLVKP